MWVFRTIGVFLAMSLIIAIPAGLASIIVTRSGDFAWKIPAHDGRPEMRIPLLRLIFAGWLGSFAGVILSFLSLFVAGYWDHLQYPDRVQDGQAPLALIFSAPVCGILGSVFALVGVRLFSCSSNERLWCAPSMYSGQRQLTNRLTVIAIAAGLCGSVFFCGFLLNWVLVHAGRF